MDDKVPENSGHTPHELEDQLERYQSLADLVADYLWELDADNKVTWVSPKFDNFLADVGSNYLNRPITQVLAEFIAHSSAFGGWDELLGCFSRGEAHNDIHVFSESATSGRIDWSVSGFPILDDAGQYKGMRGAVTNIRKRILAEQDLRLQSLVLQSMSDAVAIIDGNGITIDCNPAYEATFGITRDQFIGTTGKQIWEKLSFEGGSLDEIFQSLATDGSWHQEFTIRGPNGDRRSISGMGYKLYLDSKTDNTRVSILQDITDRKKAEQQLVHSEERFRSVVMSSSDVLWETDTKANYTYVFGWQDGVTGSRNSGLIGQSVLDYFKTMPGSVGGEATYEHIVDQQAFTNLEVMTAHEDGRHEYWLISGSPYKDADGRVAGFRGISTNVTERKLFQQQLALSEERFRNVVAASSDLIWETDIEGRYTYVSEWMDEMTGLERAGVIGLTLPEYNESQGVSTGAEELQQKILSRAAFRDHQSTLTLEDGKTIHWSTSGGPLQSTDGTYIGCRGITRDITEQVKRDEQLRQAQRMEAVGQLTGGVAHDFNNILMSMQLNLEFLQPLVPHDSEGPEFIDTLVSGINRAAELTQRLLAFSRQQVLQPKAIDVNQQIGSLLNMLQRTLGEDIQITTAFNEQSSMVHLDPGQLESAVLNLSLNARHAMPKGGTLTITTQPTSLTEDDLDGQTKAVPGNFLMVSVRDTGKGMTPDIIAQVFEPFFTTKDIGQGSGLGLSMVHGFVAQSHGHIAVESEPGHGTEVKMYFPQED
jgi:PAS domain S-box-containing protein